MSNCHTSTAFPSKLRAINHRSKFWLITVAIFLIVEAAWAASGDLFRVCDLRFEGDLLLYHVEDLNNDGLKDVLVVTNQSSQNQSVERRVNLYLQNEAGFSEKPLQSFSLDQSSILFDVGDVIGDLKKELVLLKKSGIFYYPFNETGFILSPRKLLEVESAFMIPNRTPMKWELVADMNGDHVDEILIPKLTRLEVYFRAPGNNWHINELPIGMESKVSGMYDARFSVGNYAEAIYTTPFLQTEDFDADGRKDLLAVYRDSLLVFCQEESGYFQQEYRQNIPLHFGEIWRGAKIQRVKIADESERYYLMRIKDLNHDGILDAVGIRVSTIESVVNPSTDVRIYFGRREISNFREIVFFPDTPDQIIQPDGTQLVLDIVDLNHDQKFDLMIPVIKIGLQNIVKMLLTRSVEIRADIFMMNPQGFYPKKPDTAIKMVVKFSYRGGATSPVYEVADFEDDGYLDILSSISGKTLAIFSGSENSGINDRIGPKFNVLLPQNGEMVRAMDLNSDKKSDVIITYSEDNALHKYLTNVLRVLLAN